MAETKYTVSERAIAFVLLAAGLSVIAIGLLDLLGWILDIPFLTMWKTTGSQRMAPTTAIVIILFGASLCLGTRKPQTRITISLTTIFGTVGCMTALLLFILRLKGVHLSAELLGIQVKGSFDNMPVGYMSPTTAFCLLLVYGPFLVSLPYGARGSWRGWILFGFGGLISLASFVFLLAHIFGIPLALGKTTVPTSFITCVALLIMGLALLVLAVRYTGIPAALPEDAEGMSLLPYVLVFCVFIIGIFTAAYYFYHETELRFIQEVESQLLIISDLKTEGLVRWRRERLWDGTLTQNAGTVAAVRELLKTPNSLSAQRDMRDLLGKFQRHIGYDRAFLLDANGVTRMSVPDTAEPAATILVETAAASLRMEQVMLQDFYRDEYDQRVYMALLVPIFDNQDGNQALGVVVLRIDPSIYLYQHIKNWSTTSATAETLLVRREGNDVLFLNELRFRADLALTLRLPLTGNAELAAAKAVLGQKGIVDAVDYRGIPVIAAVGAVPDSPWYIVTRIDSEEVYASLRTRMWLTLFLLTILAFSACAVLALLWRQQRLRFYRRRFELTSALRDSQKRFEFALQKSHTGGWDLNLEDYTAVRTLEHDRIFGYGSLLPNWTYQMFLDHVHPEDRPEVERLFNEAIAAHSDWNFECRILRRDGQERWIWAIGGFISTAEGAIRRMAGIVQDITERKQAEEKLRLAASVFSHAREGIMITAADGTIIEANDAFCDITGYSRDEILGQNPRILKSGRHETAFYADMWRNLIENGIWQGELWNRRKNGDLFAVMPTFSAVRDDRGNTQHYVAMYTDITLLKDHEQELERTAHFDMLTNLPNRVLLADRLQHGMAQTRRREQQLAVAFLDLDGFKAINDKHGHEAGDQLLINLANHMKQTLREGDTLARLGGDEFVAVLVDTGDIEACLPLLTRLLSAASEPVQVGEIPLQVSASLGVTFYPQTEDIDAEQLLRQADQAMYEAKQAGKNRYHIFDAEQDIRIRSRYENLERIQRGLQSNEFLLYYQPKVNMHTGTVIGVEALIRWQHPEKGLLLPDQFLPAIEDHPLSIELGEWVINTALLQMERWLATGLTIPVSINVGARQLQQADFVERLRALLAAHPLVRPTNVELEVLETQAMDDLFKVSRVIDNCRKIGVSFALDDFGTGYSSLSHLKNLPVTQLKIDQSFVRNMIDDPDDLSIVEGVIGLASAFRLLVIAEGAETIEHSNILLQLGCDQVQGYGIARPMPAHQLPRWEATWRPNPAWSELPSLGHGDVLLIFAGIEHRAWIAGIEAFLKDQRDTPMPLDINQCRFGQWLNADGLARFGSQQHFQRVDLLHRQAHALAADLCKLHDEDRKQDALARLEELHGLRDALLEELSLVQQSL